jgi:hypothetical protein
VWRQKGQAKPVPATNFASTLFSVFNLKKTQITPKNRGDCEIIEALLCVKAKDAKDAQRSERFACAYNKKKQVFNGIRERFCSANDTNNFIFIFNSIFFILYFIYSVGKECTAKRALRVCILKQITATLLINGV